MAHSAGVHAVIGLGQYLTALLILPGAGERAQRCRDITADCYTTEARAGVSASPAEDTTDVAILDWRSRRQHHPDVCQ